MFGLGLGGRGYYFMDVSQKPDADGRPGVPDRDNPIYPVIATEGTWTENLRDTLATPAIGRLRTGADLISYAAFGSGTVWYANEPSARFPSTVGLPPGMDFRNAVEPPCAQIDAQNPVEYRGGHRAIRTPLVSRTRTRMSLVEVTRSFSPIPPGATRKARRGPCG